MDEVADVGMHRSLLACTGSRTLNMKPKGFFPLFRKEMCERGPCTKQNTDVLGVHGKGLVVEGYKNGL